MAEIKLLVHAAERRTAQTMARNSGVRPSESVWCQDPAGLRGLSLSHLRNMRQLHSTPCDSKLCDESLARLRSLGWAAK